MLDENVGDCPTLPVTFLHTQSCSVAMRERDDADLGVGVTWATTVAEGDEVTRKRTTDKLADNSIVGSKASNSRHPLL